MPTILTKGEGELPDYCLFSRTISARNKNFKVTVEKKNHFFLNSELNLLLQEIKLHYLPDSRHSCIKLLCAFNHRISMLILYHLLCTKYAMSFSLRI